MIFKKNDNTEITLFDKIGMTIVGITTALLILFAMGWEFFPEYMDLNF